MASYILSVEAKADLIRIHQFGTSKFGMAQADKYFNSIFQHFDLIAQRPFSFEPVDFIKVGYKRCVCGADSIYFKVNGDIVEIIAIVGRQDLRNILFE